MDSAKDSAPDQRWAGSPAPPPLSAIPCPRPFSVIAPTAAFTPGHHPLESRGTDLTREYPNTAKEWGWQFLFPAERIAHASVTVWECGANSSGRGCLCGRFAGDRSVSGNHIAAVRRMERNESSRSRLDCQ